MVDSHGTMSVADYDLLRWILERTEPEVVTLEYGGTDPDFTVPESDFQANLRTQHVALREIVTE